MFTAEKKVDNNIQSYKMTNEEKLNITNELKDAIEINKKFPQKMEWSSKKYREKYGI